MLLLCYPVVGHPQQTESQARIENIANAAGQGALMATSIASIPGGVFSPYPISLGFEVAGYAADLGLVNTGPVFEAPSDRVVLPNVVSAGGQFCRFRFTQPVLVDEDDVALKSDYSSLFYINYKPLTNNFGDLGMPRQIYHANADVVVSASNPNFKQSSLLSLVQLPPEFPSGVHRIDWEARTQMNLILDVSIPTALLLFAGYSEFKTAQKIATGAIKASVKNDAGKQLLLAVAKELGQVTSNLELQDSLDSATVPTTANTDVQFLTVLDTTGPYFAQPGNQGPLLNQQTLFEPLEATDFGGVRLARVEQELRRRFLAVDDCGEALELSLDSDINTLLPTGQTSQVDWSLREIANGPFVDGYQPVLGQRFENGILLNSLTQSITVEDTQAPLLVPPPGFAAERNSPLPVSEILSRSFPVGRPLITDLADATPVTDFSIAGAPLQLELDQRYVVRWSSVDDSGNSTAFGPFLQDRFDQIVTLKQPNTNTPPTAQPASATGITSRPIEISLAGSDVDVLPVVGRDTPMADPLAFVIKDYPDEGEFEAPLYPYFIHDYRLTPNGEAEEGDNLSRVSPLGPLAAGFNAQSNGNSRQSFLTDNICATSDAELIQRFNRVIPVNFQFGPLYIQVLDNGDVYLLDQYFYCADQGAGVAENGTRLSLWSASGELLEMLPLGSQSNPGAGSQQPSPQWALDETQVAADGFSFEGQKLVFDADGNLLVTVRWAEGGAQDLQFCFRTYSVASDFSSAQQRGKTCGPLGTVLFPYGVVADLANGVNIMVNRPDAQTPTDGAAAVVRVYDARFDNFYGDEGLIGIIEPSDGDIDAFSVSIDSLGAVYALGRTKGRVYKFSPTVRQPDGSWELGEYVGWMGKCDQNGANAAGVPFNACDEAKQVSLGYSCTDEKCLITGPNTRDSTGPDPGQFLEPQHLAIDSNDILYVADTLNSRIQRFGPDGTFAGEAASEGTGFTIGNFGEPRNVSVNAGSMYILDSGPPFFDVFLHSFKTQPFFDVTPSSAKVKYISHFDHQGADSFSYAVTDGIAESAPALVDVSVSRAFRSPQRLVATCYAQQSLEDVIDCETPEDGAGLYVELSAYDPDGFLSTGGLDSLTFGIVEEPDHGELVELNQGTDSSQVYLYTPATDFHGEDEFEFSASDGVATVAVENPIGLIVQPTPDAAQVAFEDDLTAARGFPFALVAQYSDIDANDVVPELLELAWGDGVKAIAQDGWLAGGRTDLNGEIVNPQMHLGRGRGIVLGTHAYETSGLKTVAIVLSNEAENIAQPSVGTARVRVIDATLTAARLVAPMQPIDPDQPFGLNIEVANLPPSSGAGLAAANTVASFTLPAGLELVSGDSRCAGNSEISCELGTLASGASTTIAMQARIPLAQAREIRRYDLDISLTDAGPKVGALSKGFGAVEIADSDGDSVIDVDDAFVLDDRYSLDTDGDGLPDAWEQMFGYDPGVADNTGADSDGDGVSLLDEFLRNSFPELADASRQVESVTLRAPIPASNDSFGSPIVHADFDQDGYSDFVVGAYQSATTGRAVVYYGRPDGPPVSQELIPANSAVRAFGRSLAVADFDGNGRADLLVTSDSGAYVYYNEGALPLQPSTTVDVTSAGVSFTALAVGDLDNDGIADLASSYRRDGNSRGVRLFLSANDPQIFSGEQANPLHAVPVIIEDERPYAHHDALIIDVNGEGLNDLVLAGSQPADDRVDLFFGESIDWNDPGLFFATRILPAPAGQGRFGYSLAGGFDLGDDGITDLVVGSIGADSANSRGWVNIYDSSEIYWNGALSERQPVQTLVGRSGLVGANDARGDSFGADLALGQLDDDGGISLIVGASRAGAEDTGEVHIYRATGTFASNQPFNPTPVQIIEGRPASAESENDRNSVFGAPMAVVGDVDGDGVDDLAVGGPGFGVGSNPASGFVRLYVHGYSPADATQDADGDGVRDSIDSCPTVSNTDRANTDGDSAGDACDDDDDNDQLSDAYEVLHGLDPLRADASDDLDGDGISNIDEFILMLSPSDPDTDRDGISDGDELSAGSDPLIADTDADGLINTVDLDDDADGVADSVEQALGLDPLNRLDALADRDGDGFSNLAELQAATDVNDQGSMPETGAFSRLVASVLPGHRSTQTGNAVTAFATIINTADEAAEDCSIVPLRPIEARWSYTPTDPATNTPSADNNTPVAIEPGAAQSYIFEIQPDAPMSDELELRFDCGNTAPVNTIVGLNTFGLTVANEPVVDMVALTATLSGDGIVGINGAGGSSAFAVASVNVGAGGSVTARVRGASGLPIVVGICETNPVTGACLNNQVPRADWLFDVAANGTPTFSVFATATGDIPLDPANNRIVVEFVDSSGGRVGASSVAVTTQ